MLKKLAVIRGSGVRDCPYGLPIPSACKSVGDAIYRMQPLDEVADDRQSVFKTSNRRILRHYANQTPCPYSEGTIKGKPLVNCDFGDTAAGTKDIALPASPIYPTYFNSLWPTGLLGYPVNFYYDNWESRQIFSGIYTIYSKTGEVHLNGDAIDLDPILLELSKI